MQDVPATEWRIKASLFFDEISMTQARLRTCSSSLSAAGAVVLRVRGQGFRSRRFRKGALMAFAYDVSVNERKNYDQLLIKAVAGLPRAAADARREVYERARAALRKQLQSMQLPGGQADIVAEERALNEAIERVEASLSEELTPVAPPPRRSGSWLTDILGRASRETPLTAEYKQAAQPASSAPSVVDFAHKLTEEKRATLASRLKQARERPSASSSPPAPASGPKEGQGMSRLDDLNKILRKLPDDSPGIEASALISEDGLMIASALAPNMEETRVAGMAATLQSLGSRAAIELGRGATREVIVRGENGYAVLISTGRGAVLLAIANESAKLGLIFFDMHEAIKALQRVL
jgi:predicted regulator of Ras-like GTPase activity (Roadblock/LC7/MglB family)